MVWHYIEDDDVEEVYKITFGVDKPVTLIATAVAYVTKFVVDLVCLIFIESFPYSLIDV